MPKRTFLPSLYRYFHKHGFLRRVREMPHVLRRQKTLNMQKRASPQLGPKSGNCKRRPRSTWMQAFP